MRSLERGTFRMGERQRVWDNGDGERPVHWVELSSFEISETCVTTDSFGAFVADTDYRTEAEREGWSFVFGGHVSEELRQRCGGVLSAPWWLRVPGASWAHPDGPGTHALSGRPVVHVTWNDAVAFCDWLGNGARLPTEAEWEYAARGGRAGTVFPWGDELTPDGTHRMNVWQGEFPFNNTADDGWVGVCPVDSYEPNGFGLYCVTGNVWEWCADWYAHDYYERSPRHDPRGPEEGEVRVQRGGSYLCHASYCARYRCAARHAGTPDSSVGNVGFRVAR